MKVFVGLSSQIMTILVLSLLNLTVYSPVGEDLGGMWKSGNGGIDVPFLVEREEPLVMERVVDGAHGGTLVIPQVFARYVEIKINGETEAVFGREDIDSFWNEPVMIALPDSPELILALRLLPGYGVVGIPVKPFITDHDIATTKFVAMRFLGPYISIFSVTLPVPLFLLLMIMSRYLKGSVRKAFSLMAFTVLLSGFSVLDYTPFEILLSSIFGEVFVDLTIFTTALSPVLFIASLELFNGKRPKFHRYVAVGAAASILAMVLFENLTAIFLSPALLLVLTAFFAFLLDKRYFHAVAFTAMTSFHDFITLRFNDGFPQLTPFGIAMFNIGVAAILAQDYGRIRQELEKLNVELVSSNEELAAMNEELEAMYEEQENLTNRLENLIKLTSKIVSGNYDFENPDVFLKKLLEKAMDMIPEADYGSVSLIEGGHWRYVHAVGHDIEKLEKIDFSKDDFIDLRTFRGAEDLGEGVYLVEDTTGRTVEKMNERRKDEFIDATLPVSRTLISQLKADEEFLGHLTVDIAGNSEKEFSRDSIRIFSALGNIASAFLAFRRLAKLNERFQKEIILSMIHIVEMHDPYTKGHSESVARYTMEIAKRMGLSEDRVNKAYWAGLVHDIGKLLVPGDVLRKRGRLDDEEYALIKRHPVWGYEVLIYSEHLRDIAIYTRHHHERFDGKGYPDGLKGDSIPLISRIITVADTWDAMRSDRAYRKALPLEVAKRELIKGKGRQFDPDVVDVFLDMLSEGEVQGHHQ